MGILVFKSGIPLNTSVLNQRLYNIRLFKDNLSTSVHSTLLYRVIMYTTLKVIYTSVIIRDFLSTRIYVWLPTVAYDDVTPHLSLLSPDLLLRLLSVYALTTIILYSCILLIQFVYRIKMFYLSCKCRLISVSKCIVFAPDDVHCTTVCIYLNVVNLEP